MARFLRKLPVANLLVAVACALLLAACSKEDVKPDMRLVEAFVEVRMIEQTYGAESPAARLSRSLMSAATSSVELTRPELVAMNWWP